jgi:hypothetical protein
VLFPEVDVCAMINLITAISRTADIELNLTFAMHARKFTHAVFAKAGTGLGGHPPWGWP